MVRLTVCGNTTNIQDTNNPLRVNVNSYSIESDAHDFSDVKTTIQFKRNDTDIFNLSKNDLFLLSQNVRGVEFKQVPIYTQVYLSL